MEKGNGVPVLCDWLDCMPTGTVIGETPDGTHMVGALMKQTKALLVLKYTSEEPIDRYCSRHFASY